MNNNSNQIINPSINKYKGDLLNQNSNNNQDSNIINIQKSEYKYNKEPIALNENNNEINNISIDTDMVKNNMNCSTNLNIESNNFINGNFNNSHITNSLPNVKDKNFDNVVDNFNVNKNNVSDSFIKNIDSNNKNYNNNFNIINYSNNINNNNNNFSNILNNNINNSNVNNNQDMNQNNNNFIYNINLNNININNFNIFDSNFKQYKNKYNGNANYSCSYDKLNENNFEKNINQFNLKNSSEYIINFQKKFRQNNLPLMLDNYNNKNNLINKNNNEINIQFSFETGRKVFLTLNNDNITFGEVILMLIQKYEWMESKNIGQMTFLYNGAIIKDMNKAIKEYNIKNDDIILVVNQDE